MAVADKAGRKEVEDSLKACDTAFVVSWFLAIAFLIRGVVGELTQIKLGLESTTWFMLLIAALLNALVFRMGWATAWYLRTTK